MSKLKSLNKVFAVLLVFTFLAGIVAPGMSVAYAKDKSNNDLDIKKLISDIEDKDAKEAVERLAAFGIINGKEDGKYHPDEKVTREEFAKILVTSLKMSDAAKAGLGFAHFSDVAADRWSAGYIGIAAGHGLIKGYPDGTFKPANEVSYAEAVTMLVRALGYKDEFLTGTWPANYLAKAAEKEITKKVKFSSALGFSDRGDVAIMVNNTLDAKVVKVDTYEGSLVKYYESEKTLLEDKLNIEKLEDARVIANKRINDGLKEDEVTIREFEKKKKENFDDNDYDFINDVNPEIYLGEEVNVYLNDDDEIIYLEKTNGDKPYFDYVQKVVFKDEKISALDLAKADDDYEFDENAVIYVLEDDKYKPVKLDSKDLIDLEADKFEGKVGKFVLKNRKIVYAEVMDMGEAEPWLVVMENKNQILKGVCEDDDEFELDLTKDGNYDGVIVLDIEGYELDVDDIEKGDLVYAQKQSYDGDDYAVVRVVKDNILKGKLDHVKDNKVKVGSDERKVVYFDQAEKDNKGKYERVFRTYYSIDDGEEIKQFDIDNSEFVDDMEDADEEEIIAYTDAVGRIAYYVTEAEATSGYRYGIVTRRYSDNDRLRIFTITEKGDDEEINFKVEKEKDVRSPFVLNEYGQKTSEIKRTTDENFIKEGTVVKFKLNKDGEIAEDKLYAMNPEHLWKITVSDDFGSDYLPKAALINKTTVKPVTDENKPFADAGFSADYFVNDKGEVEYKSFSVDDNVVIIDAEGFKFHSKGNGVELNGLKADTNDADDFGKGDWKELAKANGMNGYFYVLCDDDKEVNAKAVIFIGNGSGSAANDEIGIYVKSTKLKGGDYLAEYMEYGENKLETRIVDNADDVKLKKERPYIAKVKSNGKLEIIEPGENGTTKDDFSIVYGKILERKSDSITLEEAFRVTKGTDDRNIGKKMFNISSKTLVWEEDTKKNSSNLVKGDIVLMVVEKGSNARVIERLIDSERKSYENKIKDGGKGGNSLIGDVTFEVVSSQSSATMTAPVSRSVTVAVYADFADDWKAESDFTVEVDRDAIKASGIAARSISVDGFENGKVVFTAVFTADIYVGDTLEIADNAIVIKGKTEDGSVQKAAVKKARLGIKD